MLKDLVTMLWCLSLLLSAGCNNKQSSNVMLTYDTISVNKDSPSIVDTLKLKTYETLIQGHFLNILIKDNVLVCENYHDSDSIFSFYTIDTGRLMHRAVKRGFEKNEGMSVGSVYIGNKNQLWVNDITAQKFYVLNLPSINGGKTTSAISKEIYLGEGVKNVDSFIGTGDNLFIGTSYSLENQRYLITDGKRILEKYGILPPLESKELERKLQNNINSNLSNIAIGFKAYVVKAPTVNRLIFLYNKTNRVEVYNDNNLKKAYNVSSVFYPIMNIKKEGDAFLVGDNIDTTYAFTSVTSDSKYVYSLYSGNKGTCSNKLVIFDWDGNIVKWILLDRSVCAITKSPNDNILYMYDAQNKRVYNTIIKV